MERPQSVTMSESETAVTIVGSGELDVHNQDELREALDSAAATGKTVRIDLRSASYIDTAIVAHIGSAARTVREDGRTLCVLVQDGSHPQYVLRAVGFSELMEFVSCGAAE